MILIKSSLSLSFSLPEIVPVFILPERAGVKEVDVIRRQLKFSFHNWHECDEFTVLGQDQTLLGLVYHFRA